MKKAILFFIISLLSIPIFYFGKEINLDEQYRIIENLKTIFYILFDLFCFVCKILKYINLILWC